ncbi:ATP-binding protein [Streptomyces sp. 6N223]|uniref:ATP-binding protein n=1 Tax=Streptomyces sp. 6N223 TaxID=3457412 RepID=UPI003FD37465
MAFSSHTQPLTRHNASTVTGARFTFHLPAVEPSAAEARRRVRRQLALWHLPEATCDNAQLVVSELVTNALRHTRSQTVACELRLAGPLLRIAVAGDGSGPSEVPGEAGEEDEGGRGLFLVCALSEGWGVRPRDSGQGHVVWADLTARPGSR